MNTNCDKYEVRVYGYASEYFYALNDAAALRAARRRYGADQSFKLTNVRTQRTIENGNN